MNVLRYGSCDAPRSGGVVEYEGHSGVRLGEGLGESARHSSLVRPPTANKAHQGATALLVAEYR